MYAKLIECVDQERCETQLTGAGAAALSILFQSLERMSVCRLVGDRQRARRKDVDLRDLKERRWNWEEKMAVKGAATDQRRMMKAEA